MGIVDHLPRLAHAGTFHQLDVDAREGTLNGLDVLETLYRLIGKDGERTALCQPCRVVDLLLRHGLLHHDHALLLEPVDFVKSLSAVFPSLVHVHSYRQVGNAAYGLNHLVVVLAAQLYL